jgi:cytochrome c oxidase cbb3-type subunit I/II
VGILLYVVSMWVSGITQGMMWRAQNEAGGLLYPNFVETLLAIKTMYWTRLVGGTLYLAGFVIMAWNLVMTARSGSLAEDEVTVTSLVESKAQVPWRELAFGKPVIVSLVVCVLLAAIPLVEPIATVMLMTLAIGLGIFGTFVVHARREGEPAWHALLEGRALWFSGFTVLAVLAGGVAEIVPSVVAGQQTLANTHNVPYRALELEGRDVYLKEGCYNCHSQMIRPFAWESARYGEISLADDSVFDHPFQWGSKRTGPDLARVGGKYNHQWHYRHMLDPREISPGSNMPSYAHLANTHIDFGTSSDKMRAMRTVGVPYKPEQIAAGPRDARLQAEQIARELTQGGEHVAPDSELVALISYLQRLGKPGAPPPSEVLDLKVSMREKGGL